MLYGAAYYHEYQPYERLEDDLKLMVEANLNVVRVGESTWATWEPEDGRFELDWMRQVLDGVHEAGIKAILGTPTYAIPPWLHRKHPEIMAQRAGGQRVPYGGRQNVDLTHPAYRHHAERVVRAVVGAFADHPAVIGFQVDNEAGLELLHNHGVFQAFVDHLRRTHGTVQRLNELWGLAYWSHRLHSWADLWVPDGNTNPGYQLAWRRFQSALVTEFLAWQASIVREYKRPDQFVTHCLAGGHGRPAADRVAVAQVLDVPAVNLYYQMQDALELPGKTTTHDHPGPSWLGDTGTWMLYLQADLARSAAPTGFLVTETNALTIGEAHTNAPAYDGQWRLAAYALIARGARGVSYWHWHTCHQGNETYWQGVLNHDLEPGRCYREMSRIATPTNGSSTRSTGGSSTPARSSRSSTRRSPSSASRCWWCRRCTSPTTPCWDGSSPMPRPAVTCWCPSAAGTPTSTPAPAGRGRLASCARRSAPATRNTAISPSRSAWSQPTASPCRRERAPPPGPTAWSWRAPRR